MRYWILALLLSCTSGFATAQTQKHFSIKDSLDAKLDLSDFLIQVNGFIPVPTIITEPALGGFGFGLAPIFLNKRPPRFDTLRNGRVKIIPSPPDVTGAAAIYTVNNSWAAMGFRSGTWLKARSKYRIAGGYADINLSFYRTSAAGQDQEYEFNFKTTPILGYLMKQIKGTQLSAGIQYTFLNTELKPVAGDLPDFVKEEEIKSLVSMPGIIVEFDSRDNIFTPNKGIRLNTNLSWSDQIFGSDYNYLHLTAFGHAFHPLSSKLIGGLRYEMQQVFDDPPFYLKPYLNLRGIPIARYQGNIFSVIESEVRWDFVTRWSAVFFAGTGKAYNEWNEFDDSSWHTSGGAGFRYLIARKFGLRMGVDLARGPEQWAYYIVFGSSWLK
jgi:hypothetical protein